MAEYLREQLRPASFRGVSFAVDAASANAGRRTALHEYPMRDVPYVEDLGRATREYSLTAIIVGEDYIDRTKALLEALEHPGAGTLVHPWLGEISVIATQTGAASFDTALGRATVSLSFVEAGELKYPVASTALTSKLHSSVDSALGFSSSAFVDSLEDLPEAQGYVQDAVCDAWEKIQEVCCASYAIIGPGKAAAVGLISLRDNLSNPGGFATALVDALGFESLYGTKADWAGNALRLVGLAADTVFELESVKDLVSGSSDRKIIEQTNALKCFVRESLLIEAAGCASFVGEDGDSKDLVDDAVTTSYDSFMNVRDKVCDGLDAAALETEDDELAIELEDLRAAAHEALTERARQSARLVQWDFPAGLPLVVAAYQRYGDAERADEIARLNALHHLGFSPANGLKVLSE